MGLHACTVGTLRWTPLVRQLGWRVKRAARRLLPSIRPVYAVRRTAGPDEICGSAPNHAVELFRSLLHAGAADPGPNRSPLDDMRRAEHRRRGRDHRWDVRCQDRSVGFVTCSRIEFMLAGSIWTLSGRIDHRRGCLEVSCDANVTPKPRCTRERFLGTRLGFSYLPTSLGGRK
jgi:hypothetical protein